MVKIKICGLTNLKDYNAAVSLGADYVGFNFYRKSPRYINKKTAAEIIKLGIDKGQQKVGVFVNENKQKIKDIYEYVGLDRVQLHGDETPEYCLQLGLPFWKVFRIKDKNTIQLIPVYTCDTILLDTFSSHQYGGTGTTFDLQLGQQAIQTGKRIIIAGGISTENIGAILILSPFGIDICSSLEISPGKKSYKKMKIFFEKIK